MEEKTFPEILEEKARAAAKEKNDPFFSALIEKMILYGAIGRAAIEEYERERGS
jgi:hypothetical protein